MSTREGVVTPKFYNGRLHFFPQGAENNDFIRKEPPSLEFPTLEFPNNTKSPFPGNAKITGFPFDTNPGFELNLTPNSLPPPPLRRNFQSPQTPYKCGKNNLPYLLIKIYLIIDKCIHPCTVEHFV